MIDQLLGYQTRTPRSLASWEPLERCSEFSTEGLVSPSLLGGVGTPGYVVIAAGPGHRAVDPHSLCDLPSPVSASHESNEDQHGLLGLATKTHINVEKAL